jgi:hypothetical protein
MAEINIQRKERSVWPWLLGGLLLVGVLWFLFARNPAADVTTATDTTRTTVDSGAAAGTLAPPEGGTRSGVSRDSQP